MSRFTFTVFTPTYQRAATLHRVYDSLRCQTYKDFEWLIIDDGSIDNTRALVRAWQQEARFPIRYVFQQNSGKHVAHNRAARLAKGGFFVTLDSDDACVPEALERFHFWWRSIPDEERDGFAGVTVLCRDQKGRMVGTEFPESPLDTNSIELRFRYRVKGEKWGFQRAAVLREFPFPEPDGLKFISEGAVWRAIDRKYRTRFVNEVLRVYWVEAGPQIMNLSTLSPNVLQGRMIVHFQTLNELMSWFWVNPVEFASAASNVSRYGFQRGLGPLAILSEVRPFSAKALAIAMMPIGLVLAIRDARRRRSR